MANVSHNDALWEPAQLSTEGTYTGTKLEVPKVGNPHQLLEFLHYPMPPQQWADVGYLPIHYVFSALAPASDEETHVGMPDRSRYLCDTICIGGGAAVARSRLWPRLE